MTGLDEANKLKRFCEVICYTEKALPKVSDCLRQGFCFLLNSYEGLLYFFRGGFIQRCLTGIVHPLFQAFLHF